MGPTASGKTALAEGLAAHFDAALLSADAFQIYRRFDIGTAKPEHRELYSFIDIREPEEPFGVGEFVGLAASKLAELFQSGRSAVLVGGTGLYVRALLESYADMHPPPNPALRAKIAQDMEQHGLASAYQKLLEIAPERARLVDSSNPRRVARSLEKALSGDSQLSFELPAFTIIKLGLVPPKEALDRSIERRLSAMMERGFAKEVEDLIAGGLSDSAPAMRAIGYRTMARAVRGEVSQEEAFKSILTETRQYAKRQRTWLRKEPNLTCFAAEPGESVLAEVLRMPQLN